MNALDRSPVPRGGRSALVASLAPRRAVARLLDFLLPPVCFVCERPLAGEAGVCMSCWASMTLIAQPYCARHGTPLSYDLGPDGLCAEAIADPPPFERARAVCLHGDVSRTLVHGLKYRDRLDFAAVMARWMVRAGGDLLREADLVVAVPLHRRRLWQRRYNQSGELARAIARFAALPLETTALTRKKATARQVGLDRARRQENVRGAFHVAPQGRLAIAGRRLVLVDDVYTTGATVKACTRALQRAGVASVDVLTFARVVRD